jgi:hypothetical protein
MCLTLHAIFEALRQTARAILKAGRLLFESADRHWASTIVSTEKAQAG